MPFERIEKILKSNAVTLRELALVAGGDPATFFRDANLSGADLRGQDLRGMSFEQANLADVIINHATQADSQVLGLLVKSAYVATLAKLEKEPRHVQRASILLELVSLALRLGNRREADNFLGMYLKLTHMETVEDDVDPLEIAAADLENSDEFLTVWYRRASDSAGNCERVEKLVLRDSYWPITADTWVAVATPSLPASLVVQLLERRRISLKSLTTWVDGHEGDEGWADVVSWALALPITTGRKKFVERVMSNLTPAEERLCSVIGVATGKLTYSRKYINGLRGRDLIKFAPTSLYQLVLPLLAGASESQLRALEAALSFVMQRQAPDFLITLGLDSGYATSQAREAMEQLKRVVADTRAEVVYGRNRSNGPRA